MSDTTNVSSRTPLGAEPTQVAAPRAGRWERRGWWLKLTLQPLLLAAVCVGGFTLLGLAQQQGWLPNAFTDQAASTAAAGGATSYICPMMCTPPSTSPGRCPVCAMELVPATAGMGGGDGRSVTVTPASRRLAGIETVAARRVPRTQVVRGVGRLDYDEASRKSLASYVDGRLEKLFADYTGVQVAAGDALAVVYSPQLYAAQVELLLARQAMTASRSSDLSRVVEANAKLYASSRQKLLEMGLTASQVEDLEAGGTADSRLTLIAPISGTVVAKNVVEGAYLAEGDVIYQLADLTSLWLMLELFPEDAAVVHYGARVDAELQSYPGERFTGRVSFVDPVVDPQTQTVGVRVVMPNTDGRLRVGDYAKASIELQLGSDGTVYDPELAGRWIGPRHPHVVAEQPGDCPICGMPLVPASSLGFTDDPAAMPAVVVVPRDAVLRASGRSVVYVESSPGRFELREVVVGPVVNDEIVVQEGLAEGEEVARRGNFLIDSQMQLVGNPSLIDPQRLPPAAAAPPPAASGGLPPLGPMKLMTPDDAPVPGGVSPQGPRQGTPPVPGGRMRVLTPNTGSDTESAASLGEEPLQPLPPPAAGSEEVQP